MLLSNTCRFCTLMVHTPSHNAEDLVLNPDFFGDLVPGDFIQILDPYDPTDKLILKVPTMHSLPGRVEISISKAVAESNNLKSFSKVLVDVIDAEQASLDFVELSFKKQYLQRGNVFRLKKAMIGRPVFVNQGIEVNRLQALIQEVRKESTPCRSGVITDKTKFVFRSKSARIMWLIQISAEMWDFDQVKSC